MITINSFSNLALKEIIQLVLIVGTLYDTTIPVYNSFMDRQIGDVNVRYF